MANKILTFFKVVKKIKNFPTYFKDYLGFIKNKYIFYKLRNGLIYKIRGGSTDRFIINEVWIHNSYNPKGFEINEKDIVVDIGAQLGDFTLRAAHFAKQGKIYAFEPEENNYKLLLDNIALNKVTNVALSYKE